jgi:hypothetical protein
MHPANSLNETSGTTRFQNHHFCTASYRELLQITDAIFLAEETQIESIRQGDIESALWNQAASGVKVLSSKK